VAIFGHGFTDSERRAVAVAFARARRTATIAINVVGHGFGAGTYTATTPGGPVTVPAGGRGLTWQRHDRFDGGCQCDRRPVPVAGRDGLRQTVIDIMQLVREIQVGIDVDGNGSADLCVPGSTTPDNRSAGSTNTTAGLEPDIRAGVVNVRAGRSARSLA
jgi:hypothetical protein